jgi:hypothetical protein
VIKQRYALELICSLTLMVVMLGVNVLPALAQGSTPPVPPAQQTARHSTEVRGSDAPKVKRLWIPDTLNTVATYPIAAANDTQNSFWAWGFVRSVLAADGQLVLWKRGFITNIILTRSR